MDRTEIKRIESAIIRADSNITCGLYNSHEKRWATIRLTSGEHIRIQRDCVTQVHNVNDPDISITPELSIEDIPTPFGIYVSSHGYSIDLIIRQPLSAMCRAITIDARYIERITESREYQHYNSVTAMLVESVMVNTIYHRGEQ